MIGVIMAKELSTEDVIRARLEIKFYTEDPESKKASFDPEKSTRYILSKYDIVHTQEQGYFIFNGKYWKNVKDNYIAQIINEEMDIISKPNHTDQILKQISHKQYLDFTKINENRDTKMILSNGTLDISDWNNPIFIEGEFIRDDFSTIHFDYPYEADAKCPEFHKYLSTTFEENPEDIRVVQEMFGYCLTTSTKHEKIFLLYGEGGSGKSVLIDTLKTFVSESNYSSVPMSLLDKSFLRAGLKDKILNFSTEECSRLVKDSAINWLKAISSGDPIEAQFKMKDTFNFKTFCKLVQYFRSSFLIFWFTTWLKQRKFALLAW
jgi:putative DNA primase/helicase